MTKNEILPMCQRVQFLVLGKPAHHNCQLWSAGPAKTQINDSRSERAEFSAVTVERTQQ